MSNDTPDSRHRAASATGQGFAAAVVPVTAQTVHTPSDGLLAGAVTIPVGAHPMNAYRAMPAGGRDLPVVLVLSEIFGVHEHIADVARRFARLGYLAIAPELFERQGDAKAPQDIATLLAGVVSKVPDAQVMGDLDACVAWAAGAGGDLARVAAVGFCWGGRIAWLYAAHSPRLRAAVAWYGRLTGPKDALHPAHPVDVAARLRAPVLGLYAGQDAGIAIETVEQMKTALALGGAAALESRFVVYPEVGHAFLADYRPGFNAAAAQDSWTRGVDWLRLHGAA